MYLPRSPRSPGQIQNRSPGKNTCQGGSICPGDRVARGQIRQHCLLVIFHQIKMFVECFYPGHPGPPVRSKIDPCKKMHEPHKDAVETRGEGWQYLAVPPSRGTATLDGALLVRLSTPRLVRSKRNRITRRSHLISTLTGCDSRNRGSMTDPFCSLAVPFLKLSI